MSLPLAGLKVLDLSRLLPGPYCTLILADLGADVLKLEEPGGDYLRWWTPSATFQMLNRNKRAIALDLKNADDRATALRLADKADVLVESFRPGVLDKLGLGYETLRARNPRLIMCAITGYGQTGPLKDRAGHDMNFVARSGLLAHNAAAGQAPHPLSVQLADLAGGALYPATGILAALYAREKSGQGTFIDAAMSDACVALMPFLVSAQVENGAVDAPGEGMLHGGVPAYAVYPTQDGRHLAVAGLEPKFWQKMCSVLAVPELHDSGLVTGAESQRVQSALRAIFMAQPLAYWVERFSGVDCCVEPVLSVAEALRDSHHTARGLFVTVAETQQVRTPIFMRGADPTPARPAPLLNARALGDWLD